MFITWIGDHAPRHVHVYRNGRLVLKWNLEDGVRMTGRPIAGVVRLIEELEEEGRL